MNLAKLRKLATDCRDCRHGFCCGRCLCCLPEEVVREVVHGVCDQVRKRPRRSPR